MRALVVGAGIAGLSSACSLRWAGYEVLVVDRAIVPSGSGFMLDFFGAGFDAAEAMGLVPELTAVHHHFPQWCVRDGCGEFLFAHSYTDVRRRVFGSRHFNLLRGELERTLLRLVHDEVELRFSASVLALRPEGQQVFALMSDGQTGLFDLVVGASGAHSSMRRLAFGISDSHERSLGFDAAALIVRDAALRAAVGDGLCSLTAPGRRLVVHPLRDDRVAALFAHERPETLTDRTRASVCAELSQVYGDFGWQVPRLLGCLDRATDVYYDAVTQVELPRWSVGRIVLVGDACRGNSPLSAQGASLALAGGWVLGQELVAARGDVIRGLHRYEERMRPVVARTQVAGRRVARWIMPKNKMKMLARDIAIRLSSAPVGSGVLKRALGVPAPLR